MPEVAELGHVGVYVSDLERSRKFYTDVLGLHVTDEEPEWGLVFLSSRPDFEHHELMLVGGRDAAPEAKVVQQISFRCPTLEDVIAYYERFVAEKVPIEMVVSHGNAVGVYFKDPDENVAEVYWSTGLPAKQPFAEELDLTKTPDEIMAEVRRAVDEKAALQQLAATSDT